MHYELHIVAHLSIASIWCVLLNVIALQAEGTFHYPELFEQKDVEELREMEKTPEDETPPDREISEDIKNWLQF